MCEVKWLAKGARFTEGDLIRQAVEGRRADLLEEWEMKVRHDDQD